MAVERSHSPKGSSRQVKRNTVNRPGLVINNVDPAGETVHHRALILTGTCADDGMPETPPVLVYATDAFGRDSEPTTWPVCRRSWKAMVLLSPGTNTIHVRLDYPDGSIAKAQAQVTYLPLLQLPPLHLAILVAKDSPLLIDCPPTKYGTISEAHSGLDAAIAKLRTSAYMWQAATADAMLQNGLGRRSFRLDEEWTKDTTTLSSHRGCVGLHVPKVHIVRCDKTVAQLRDPIHVVPWVHGAVHTYFKDALRAYGPPFSSELDPVVAGLILDSHFDLERKFVLAHSERAGHAPSGLSIANIGSHTTHSWPRFVQEIPACLLDSRACGDTVGIDGFDHVPGIGGREGLTMSNVCCIGHRTMLKLIGRAFGAVPQPGITEGDAAQLWRRRFLSDGMDSGAIWTLKDALRIRRMPHFTLPGDKIMTKEQREMTVEISSVEKDGQPQLVVSCPVGLARVQLLSGNGKLMREYNFDVPPCSASRTERFKLNFASLRADYGGAGSVGVAALAQNGAERVVANVWKLPPNLRRILIPESSVVLTKRSIKIKALEGNDESDNRYISWALLLTHRGPDEELHRAVLIELRVDAVLDGATVHYADGSAVHCGDPEQGFNHYGGHTYKVDLPETAEISKVEITRPNDNCDWTSLYGIRITTTEGRTWGEIRPDSGDLTTHSLEPDPGEVVVGFYGRNERQGGYACEFGVITAPVGERLPDVVYDMPELRNEPRCQVSAFGLKKST